MQDDDDDGGINTTFSKSTVAFRGCVATVSLFFSFFNHSGIDGLVVSLLLQTIPARPSPALLSLEAEIIGIECGDAV